MAARDSAVAADFDLVFDLFPRLRERTGQLAGALSGGEQQMLAIARALMSRPKLLLLDEPSMGLARMVVKDIFATLRRLNQMGVSMLLAEQNTRMALRTASRGYVLVRRAASCKPPMPRRSPPSGPYETLISACRLRRTRGIMLGRDCGAND